MDYSISPLKQSLFIIHWVSTQLTSTLEKTNKDAFAKLDEYSQQEFLKLSLIRFCIIMEEWQKLDNLAKNDIKLRNTLKMTKPLIKELKKWTGINKYRSSVLAHFGRNKSGQFIPYWRALDSFKYPTTTFDFTYINAIVRTASETLLKRHQADLKQVQKLLWKDREKYEKRLYKHDLSIYSDQELEERKKILWEEFKENLKVVWDEEKSIRN